MAEYTFNELLSTVTTAGREASNERLRDVSGRVVAALYGIIRDCGVTPEEFWAGVAWLAKAGSSGEIGLVTAALGFDRLLDVLSDERERASGATDGTPRAIEGPLYIPDAPLCQYEARLDENVNMEGEVLLFSGRVLDPNGNPLPGAIVDVWHASPKGRYSHFDPSLPNFVFRRRIAADTQGRYAFRTLMPAGYRVPPGGPTDQLLNGLGRHGWRPAHIHFMVSAPNMAKLTTQINLPGDVYLNDDMAFATRDELIVTTERHNNPAELREHSVDVPFTTITFDFRLSPPVRQIVAHT